MKFLDAKGKIVAETNDWAELAFIVENDPKTPPAKAMTIAYWCIADIARMDNFGVDDLLLWVNEERCPFWGRYEELKYGGDWLFEAAGLLWFCGFICHREDGTENGTPYYTPAGKKRALMKAAREPVKTLKELAYLYAEDRRLTIVTTVE